MRLDVCLLEYEQTDLQKTHERERERREEEEDEEETKGEKRRLLSLSKESCRARA